MQRNTFKIVISQSGRAGTRRAAWVRGTTPAMGAKTTTDRPTDPRAERGGGDPRRRRPLQHPPALGRIERRSASASPHPHHRGEKKSKSGGKKLSIRPTPKGRRRCCVVIVGGAGATTDGGVARTLSSWSGSARDVDVAISATCCCACRDAGGSVRRAGPLPEDASRDRGGGSRAGQRSREEQTRFAVHDGSASVTMCKVRFLIGRIFLELIIRRLLCWLARVEKRRGWLAAWHSNKTNPNKACTCVVRLPVRGAPRVGGSSVARHGPSRGRERAASRRRRGSRLAVEHTRRGGWGEG